MKKKSILAFVANRHGFIGRVGARRLPFLLGCLGLCASVVAAEPSITGPEVFAKFSQKKTVDGPAAEVNASDWANGEKNGTAGRVSRTFARMARATAERPETVRILFYGQSIVAQNWGVKHILPKLKARYPHVRFVAENRAIGGYESPVLIRTAESDLYPFYPDLLFFHVYGPTDKYAEIVRRVRARTTADVVLWTSHLNVNEGATREKIETLLKESDARSRAIREVSESEQCMFVDLRAKWCRMLLARGEVSKAYLVDSVHLNGRGQTIYAEMLWEDLPQVATETPNEKAGTVTTFPAALRLSFTGNRVTAVSDGGVGGEYDVFLDGKPVSSFGEMWAFTRTSPGISGTMWPMLSEVRRTAPSCADETWKLIFTEGLSADGKIIPFRVEGSVTGFDGAGWNTNDFVSTSGRVVVDRSAWPNFNGKWGRWNYLKKLPKPGLTVTWRNVPLFTSPYRPAAKNAETVLVQNCANGPHVLELRPRAVQASFGFSHFNVYSPYRK